MNFTVEEDVNSAVIQSGFEFFVLPLENSVEWLNLKKDIELLSDQPSSPFQDLLDEANQIKTLILPLFTIISKNYKNRALKSATIHEYLARNGKIIDEDALFQLILDYCRSTLSWTFMPRRGDKFWLKPISIGNAKIVRNSNNSGKISPNISCIFAFGFKLKSGQKNDGLEILCENKHTIFDFHPDFSRNNLIICPHCNSPKGKFYLVSNLDEFFTLV